MIIVKPDSWHFPRPDFANRLAEYLLLSSSTAYEGPWGAGKTSFLLRDLAPAAAITREYQPVYLDLHPPVNNATVALTDALRIAAQELHRPELFDLSIDPAREYLIPGGRQPAIPLKADDNEPDDELFRIRYWADQLVLASDKPILLIVDEIQSIGTDVDGDATAAALRAALIRLYGHLIPVFTASHSVRFAAMFFDYSAPFFQFGSQSEFPPLGRNYLEHLAERYAAAVKEVKLDIEALSDAFEALDKKPGTLRAMVESMAASRSTDISAELKRQLEKI
ncbi:MAG: hypothetical protein CMN28_12265 [Salinisphaeraceae bacterium]|nr:hypothetical protein [Salinisphaeraceae bacterium]